MEFELTYGEVESLLMTVLQVPEEKRMRLRSRVQHLQRAEFPPGVNVGRGSRYSYDQDATLQLLFAFALLDLNWTSLAAAKFIEAEWAAFQPYIKRGLEDRQQVRTQDKRPQMIIEPSGLHNVGRGLGRKTGAPTAEADGMFFKNANRSLAYVVLDVAKITRLARQTVDEQRARKVAR